MHDYHTEFFKVVGEESRISGRSEYNVHSFINANLYEVFIVFALQGDVDSEGVFSPQHGLRFFDVFTQEFRFHGTSPDQTKTTSF